MCHLCQRTCSFQDALLVWPCGGGGGEDATKVFRDARQETATIPGNDPSPKPMESRWGDCGENNSNSETETEYDRNSTSNNKNNDNSAAVTQTRMLTTITAEQKEWE